MEQMRVAAGSAPPRQPGRYSIKVEHLSGWEGLCVHRWKHENSPFFHRITFTDTFLTPSSFLAEESFYTGLPETLNKRTPPPPASRCVQEAIPQKQEI